jgi:phosphoglycerate dehydrogenase-like enzyme
VNDTEPAPTGHPLLACEQIVPSAHKAEQTPADIEVPNVGAVDNVP